VYSMVLKAAITLTFCNAEKNTEVEYGLLGFNSMTCRHNGSASGRRQGAATLSSRSVVKDFSRWVLSLQLMGEVSYMLLLPVVCNLP